MHDLTAVRVLYRPNDALRPHYKNLVERSVEKKLDMGKTIPGDLHIIIIQTSISRNLVDLVRRNR